LLVPLQEALLLLAHADLLLHGGAAVGALGLCLGWAALQRHWVTVQTGDCSVWQAQVSILSTAGSNQGLNLDELPVSITVVMWKALN